MTPTLADVDSLLDRCLTLATPPVREPLSDWADQHRVLSSEAITARRFAASADGEALRRFLVSSVDRRGRRSLTEKGDDNQAR